MCGIAGIIDLNQKPEISLLNKASHTMRHRGPDANGMFCEESIALLHCRLSIIDLTTGLQPMFNEDKTLVIIFNGEIYNFINLRDQLIDKGHVFTTQSDTETILHAYEEWGKDCVKKFHGMFAFAIYNRIDHSLFLARDRCGEKPLYYYHTSGKFIFASEIKTLLTILKTTPSPDPKAIYSYLRLGYIPAPYSYFNGIKKLPQSSYLFLQNDNLQEYQYYYQIPYKSHEFKNRKISENELCDELDNILSESVKKMLISDVPLGAFLSGGLDSSLIVAMMAKYGARPSTFSITFDQDSYDESIFSNKVAQIIGTYHTEYKVKLGELEELISIMDGFDEPFADSSSIPLYYLSKETKKKVTVALSGDGGDELFGGYRRYIAQHFRDYYLKIPDFIRNQLISKFLLALPDKDVYYADSILKSIRIFTQRVASSDIASGLMLNTIFSHNEILSLFPDLPDGRDLIEDRVKAKLSNSIDALIYADLNLYLPDDILVKVDRMSMKNSLEIRAPFLDPQVLEFSQKIPLGMKIRGLTQKYILKKVALRYLPPEIVFRKKHGFMIPMTQWLKDMGTTNIKKSVSTHINDNKLGELLDSHFNKKIDCSHKIFSLMILSRYLF